MDQINDAWADNPFVVNITELNDLNQPYSCSQWGNQYANSHNSSGGGSQGNSHEPPLMVSGPNMGIWSMFNTGSAFPSNVFIDHTMHVFHKTNNVTSSLANIKIQDMLDVMENSLIMATGGVITQSVDVDDDGVINPGDEVLISFTLENNSFNADALNINASIVTNAELTIVSGADVDVDYLSQGSISQFQTVIQIPMDISLGQVDVTLTLSADYINQNGITQEYLRDFFYSFDISLHQSGFPITTGSQLKPSPVVVDFDNDGSLDVLIGDYAGLVHWYNTDGSEVIDATFPYDTGNQIWGSPSAADLDNDGNIDMAITSKSKYLYLFDQYGLKAEYFADSYLMGSPAIGQLDDDEDLEVVIGGYSSSGKKIYAINSDGTDVSGFPVDVDEKMIKGVALYDFDNNGKDDIVFGSDSDNISLLLDDGTLSWSYTTGDKIQSAPSIINTGSEILVCAGSKDDNFYCLTENGDLKFSYPTGSNIYTSPSAVELNGSTAIFFGSDDGNIYAVDSNGNNLPGWPQQTDGNIVGSIAFSDMDNDGTPEIISTNSAGELLSYNADGLQNQYFPITAEFPYAGSPHIFDLDGDGDLEIFTGSTNTLIVTDMKSEGTVDGYWSTYRGNDKRTGYYEVSGSGACTTADLNDDGVIDILDIVQTINIIMGNITPSATQACAADVNSDTIIDILDIVLIVNIIMGN
jgi:hypothetical protein